MKYKLYLRGRRDGKFVKMVPFQQSPEMPFMESSSPILIPRVGELVFFCQQSWEVINVGYDYSWRT